MKKLVTIALITLGLGLAANQASASSRAYNGVWVNVDRNTQGITRMVIRASGARAIAATWGQCRPRDCSWGRARGVAYGPNIATNPGQSTRAIIFTYNQSHARTILLVQRMGHGRLRVTAFTTFTDGSRRQPYTKTYYLRKAGRHHRG